MIVEVISKNAMMSPYSRKVIFGYNLQLKKFFKRVYSIRWFFEKIRQTTHARVRVHAHSGTYVASAVGGTIREVVNAVADKIETQRRRRKRIQLRRRHQAEE